MNRETIKESLPKIITELIKKPDYMGDGYAKIYRAGWNDALKELCNKLDIKYDNKK